MNAHVRTFQGRNVFGLHKERKSHATVTKRFSDRKHAEKILMSRISFQGFQAPYVHPWLLKE